MTLQVLSLAELEAYQAAASWASRLKALVKHQSEHWPAFQQAVKSLAGLRRREISVQGNLVSLQHNPRRIGSVSAIVEGGEIEKRPCFLCSENAPAGQAGLMLTPNYVLLCNPAPIFASHFTIAALEHRPQCLVGEVEVFLEHAELLSPEMAVFFNGARAGASAPDHLHFQACPATALPLMKSLAAVGECLSGHVLPVAAETREFAGTVFVLLIARERHALEEMLSHALKLYEETQPGSGELVNVIAWFQKPLWLVGLFLRRRHRPSCYYAEGPENLLVSPGAVEMAGVIVLPRGSDYAKIKEQDVLRIYQEVSMPCEFYQEFCSKLIGRWKRG